MAFAAVLAGLGTACASSETNPGADEDGPDGAGAEGGAGGSGSGGAAGQGGAEASSGAGGTGGTGRDFMSCGDLCAGGILPLARELACSFDEATCLQNCDQVVSEYAECLESYFTAVECSLAAPLSEWSCDPLDGPEFEGPSCAAELGQFLMCAS